MCAHLNVNKPSLPAKPPLQPVCLTLSISETIFLRWVEEGGKRGEKREWENFALTESVVGLLVLRPPLRKKGSYYYDYSTTNRFRFLLSLSLCSASVFTGKHARYPVKLSKLSLEISTSSKTPDEKRVGKRETKQNRHNKREER